MPSRQKSGRRSNSRAAKARRNRRRGQRSVTRRHSVKWMIEHDRYIDASKLSVPDIYADRYDAAQ